MVKYKSERHESEITGNVQKYLSYKEAWARIEQAQKDGYYLEAVTIVESMISDRLLSFLVGIGEIDRAGKNIEKIGFFKLIDQWKEFVGRNSSAMPQATDETLSLADRVNAWRENRNLIVHGLVKSLPGTPTEDVTSFLLQAEQAAKEGAELARLVSKWHKSQMPKSCVDVDDET